MSAKAKPLGNITVPDVHEMRFTIMGTFGDYDLWRLTDGRLVLATTMGGRLRLMHLREGTCLGNLADAKVTP